MKLHSEWRAILRHAWSVRLMVVAMILTGCEALITMEGVDWVPIPKWAQMLVIFVVIGGAFVARLVAQSALVHEDE